MTRLHLSIDLHGVDDLTDMIDHAVTALRLTDVRREKPRSHPNCIAHRPFTSQRSVGRLGDVRVNVTAFIIDAEPCRDVD